MELPMTDTQPQPDDRERLPLRLPTRTIALIVPIADDHQRLAATTPAKPAQRLEILSHELPTVTVTNICADIDQ